MTAVGFEPTPLRNGALSHRLRPLGQTVMHACESDELYIGAASVADLLPATGGRGSHLQSPLTPT